MAINGAAAEKLQLIQHLPIAGNGGHAVHDLPQPQHPGVMQKLLHILGHQLGTAGFKAGAGHTGGDHDKNGQRHPFRLIQHILDAFGAANIGDLMGVGNDRCSALAQNTVGKAGGMGHG